MERSTVDMRTIIFAGGTLRPGMAVDKAIATAEQIIAADSGAETALRFGLIPHFIVGDFDSLSLPLEDFREPGSEIIQVAPHTYRRWPFRQLAATWPRQHDHRRPARRPTLTATTHRRSQGRAHHQPLLPSARQNPALRQTAWRQQRAHPIPG